MALKPPVPEKPYFPVRGWNPDANGLSIKSSECIDTLNMRIGTTEAGTRAGTRDLARNRPGNVDIIHTHNYKKASGAEVEFGFSKDNVYIFNDGTKLWSYAHKFEMFDDCEAVADWSSANWTPTRTSAGIDRYEGSYAIYVSPNANLIDTEVLLAKGGAAVMSWDVSSYTHLALQYKNTHISSIDVKINFYSDNNFTTLVESFDKTLEATAYFQEVACKMTTPGNWTTIQSWEIIADGVETVAVVFDLHVDYVCGITKLSSDVAAWDTTRFIDVVEGETVVAAGSSPPLVDDAETDGGSRVLIMYDTSAGYFSTLILKRKVGVVDEDTAEVGPASASPVTAAQALAHNSDDTGFEEIVKGTVTLYTIEKGTIATASFLLSSVNGGSNNGYFLVPVDETHVAGGANSWIKLAGKGDSDSTNNTWSIEFKTDYYNGLKIYVSYTYKEAADYLPRYVSTFHNRLLLGNTYENSTYYVYRVRATAVEDADLITATNYWDLTDTDVSGITKLLALGSYMTAYKLDSISKGHFVGGTSVFLFENAWKNEGVYASRTIIGDKNKHYVLGQHDVQVWDGASLQSITESKNDTVHRTKEKIFNALHWDKINNCFAILYPRHKEYWLFTVQSGETYPRAASVYNINQDIWYYFRFDTNIVCAGNYHVEGAPTIDELIGTVDEQNWSFEGSYTEGSIWAMILQPASGNMRVLDGTISTDGGYFDPDGTWNAGSAVASRIITRDFIYGDLPRQDRTQRVDFEAYGTSVDVSSSSDYETDPSAFVRLNTVALTPAFMERNYFPDLVGEHIRFCFESTTPWRMRWIQPYAVINELVNE